MKRFCLVIAGASMLMLTAADADAGWRYRLQRRHHCCAPVYQYHAPVTRAPAQPVQPPGAPIQGESSQAQSVEPQAPPAAPAQGRTIRRYSVEPAAPVYQQPAPSTSSQGPPRNPVERRLRPGSGFRR
jgi:hypothetical protein